MSELPQGWIECNIQDYAFVSNTKGVENKTPYLEIGDVNIANKNYRIKDKPSVKGCKKADKDDVLISRVRPTRGAVCIIKEDSIEVSSAFTILKQIAEVDKSFLFYQLAWNEKFLNYLGSNCTGTMYPTVSEEIIKEFIISIAPPNEQKRIVEKLDKLLARVEEAKARLEKIPVIIKRFRQSVLNAAVTGELTRDWRERKPEVDSGELLISKIQSDLNTQAIKVESLKNDELPETWDLAKLGAITELIGKGSSPTWQGIKYVNDGILFITSENVGSGKLQMDNPKYLEERFNQKQKRTILKYGDVLTNLVGASIGRSAIFDLEVSSNINQAVCLIRLHPLINNKFVLHYLNSPQVIDMFNEIKVDVARANVSLTQIRDLEIPIPPQEEQKEIVNRVVALFKKADEIEERYKKAKAFVDKLTQSILAKAFRGELVPQDPNDEPAEKLLERVKAEKEKLAKIKSKKKLGGCYR